MPADTTIKFQVHSGQIREDGTEWISPYVDIENPAKSLITLRNPHEIVHGCPTLRVLFSYPFGTKGPSEEEKAKGGWIFTLTAPNGEYFTRADLAYIIAAKYRRIYEE